MMNFLDQIEHLWSNHKKVVIGTVIVLIIAIIM